MASSSSRPLKKRAASKTPTAIRKTSEPGKAAKKRADVAQKPATRTAVMVLGMHRSGTSALTGVLARLGCDLPKTEMPANTSNEKGFYESNEVYRVNNALLASAGSSWQDWQPLSPDWAKSTPAEEFQEAIARVVADEFGTSRFFTLKDPRICRLLPYWDTAMRAAGCGVVVVHTHRNPLEVAQSLQDRKQLPITTGLMVWLRYVLDAEAASRTLPRSFTSFERLMQNWAGEIERIEQDLGIIFPRRTSQSADEINDFLTRDLKHFNQTVRDVPADSQVNDWIRTVFMILEKWAASGEVAADHKTLDQINKLFSKPKFVSLRASTGTGQNDASNRAAVIKSNDSPAKVKKRTKQTKTLRQQLDTMSGERDALHAELGNSHSRLQAEAEQIGALSQKLDTTSAELKTAQQDLGSTQSALAQRQHDSDEAHKEIRTLKQQIEELQAQAEITPGQGLVIASLERAVKAQQDQIQQYISQKSGLTGQLHDRFRELAMTAQLIKSLEDRNSVTEQTTNELRELTHEQARHIQDTQQQLQDAQALLAQITSERKYLQHAWDATKASTSWRLTAPIRRIKEMIRRRQD